MRGWKLIDKVRAWCNQLGLCKIKFCAFNMQGRTLNKQQYLLEGASLKNMKDISPQNLRDG